MIRVLKTHTGDLAVLVEACSNLVKLACIDENQVLITSAGGIPVHALAHHRITSLAHHHITTNVHNPGIMILASTLPHNSTNPLQTLPNLASNPYPPTTRPTPILNPNFSY